MIKLRIYHNHKDLSSRKYNCAYLGWNKNIEKAHCHMIFFLSNEFLLSRNSVVSGVWNESLAWEMPEFLPFYWDITHILYKVLLKGTIQCWNPSEPICFISFL